MTLKNKQPARLGRPGRPRTNVHRHPNCTTSSPATQPRHALLLLAALYDHAAICFKSAGSYPKFEHCRRHALMLRARWYALTKGQSQ